jgi:Molybdopterin converting factor, small subunit
MPTVRYWAGARAAAGVPEEVLPGTTVQALLDEVLLRHPQVASVISRCSFLVDGLAVHDRGLALREEDVFEVLPPFAGGAM